MLYEAYDAHTYALTSIRLMARAATAFLNQPWPPIRDHPVMRGTAATCELVARAGLSHSRPEFGIPEIRVGNSVAAITEEVVVRHPFCTLLHFRKDIRIDQPRVLIVAPLSGHFATLLRGTVSTMLPDHDVFITDWINTRNIPLRYGRFDFDDFIDLMIEFIHVLGPQLHLVAVCQSSVPVLAAVSLMAAAGEPDHPETMTLMGGPIDTRRSPTQVNRLATSRPLEWFERNVIETVPTRYPGAFRRVYPGFLQLAGFTAMNFDRHVMAHFDWFERLARGDGKSTDATRAFYDEYTSVMDLPADFYLQTVKHVFQDFALPLGKLRSRGRAVELPAVERTALMTIEGESDDICGNGQTVAAHELCTGIPDRMHSHHLQPQVGHYGIFSGRRWRTEIYPKLHDFIRARSLEQRLFRAVRVGARCRGPLLPSTRTQQRKRPRFGRAIIPNSAKGKGERAPRRAQHLVRQVVHVLQDKEPGYQPRRQSGLAPADRPTRSARRGTSNRSSPPAALADGPYR